LTHGIALLPPPKKVMFSLRSVSVCLSVCPSDNWKSCEWILTKFLGRVGHGPGTNEFNFGDDLDHSPDPGVRSLKSGFTGLSNYQRILMKFYGELGCGLETNWLHLVTIRIVIWIRESIPDHDPDPGRTATILLCWHLAEVCAIWVLLVWMLFVFLGDILLALKLPSLYLCLYFIFPWILCTVHK